MKYVLVDKCLLPTFFPQSLTLITKTPLRWFECGSHTPFVHDLPTRSILDDYPKDDVLTLFTIDLSTIFVYSTDFNIQNISYMFKNRYKEICKIESSQN